MTKHVHKAFNHACAPGTGDCTEWCLCGSTRTVFHRFGRVDANTRWRRKRPRLNPNKKRFRLEAAAKTRAATRKATLKALVLLNEPRAAVKLAERWGLKVRTI